MADTQRDALERRRVREGLPDGGEWRYDIGTDQWVYATKPDKDGKWIVFYPNGAPKLVKP